MPCSRTVQLVLCLACCSLAKPAPVAAADPFREQVVPFVQQYCANCHNADLAEAELNLARYTSAEMAAEDFRQWEHVITFVKREEMPPKSAKEQPSSENRAGFLKALRGVLDEEARKLAGDPGIVLPRRLSNAEYDHTIRDLTGVDIQPTKAFPIDPAAGEGFDNTGEALAMSPGLFQKLYAAAQHVADHAVLTTTGLTFAPHPAVTLADKTHVYEQAILQFYDDHRVDYEAYLIASWEYRHRTAERQAVTQDEWARERRLSPRYFAALQAALAGDPHADRFYMGWLRRTWNAIPSPSDAAKPQLTTEIRNQLQRLAKDIATLSQRLCPKETEAIVANAGNAPILHLDRRQRTAAERDTFSPRSIQPSERFQLEYRNLEPQATIRVVISAVPFGAESKPGEGGLILRSLNFSTASRDQYQPKDDKRNWPLRQLLEKHAPDQLERVKFGVHPQGQKIEAEDCVLVAPGTMEIELPVKAFGDLREIRFYVDAELDRQGSKPKSLLVSVSAGKVTVPDRAPVAWSSELPAQLVDPEQPLAQEIAQSGAAFCQLFPNRFYYVDETRGLSAGFHLIEGFFRDDQPLCKLVLSDAENQELNRLWKELEFVTEITEKMLRGFVFFERSERNFIKHEDFDEFKEDDPQLIQPETLNRFERIYLNHANLKKPIAELATHPIHLFFESLRNGLKLRQEQLRQAEPIYLRNLEEFAHRAYRRPLTSSELDDLRAFYREAASQSELSQEEHSLENAVRGSLVRILVSPYFGCRIDPAPEGETVQPLSNLALASRLSYFLWASMPDAELRSLAEGGKLHDEQVLLGQTRRMLQDSRTTDFAREFFGQWLGYRDFLQREAVDRNLFQEFDDSLKEAMFEEPTRLAAHFIRHNQPVTGLLDSDQTFVNERLAKHYGVPFTGAKGDWVLTEGLEKQGRGGILGMAVFLTRNSQPQRTSPVKRGFWVVHKVLGEHIPAPPADVVALPAKETDTNGKTIRELLALHVEAVKCARCHVRFDSVGLALEGFDPIGRKRTTDLAGRPVDNAVKLPDGTELRGVPDFARLLIKERRAEFVNTLCRKLLGYALGRSLQLSDEVLLHEMQTALEMNGDRFVPLFESIVRSPQFRNQRGRDFSTARFRIQNQGDQP